MKYLIHGEVPPDRGEYLETNPEAMQELLGAWQEANAEAMYFSLTRRGYFFVVEVANEDEFFEPLHKTWILLQSYPTVDPVATLEEFGAIIQRVSS